MSSQPHATTDRLEADSVQWWGVLFQSVANMGPAAAVGVALTFVAGVAGGALPLAVLLALIPCLCIAVSFAEFCRRMPSAGSVFTFVDAAAGPLAGFISGWIFLLYEPLMPCVVFSAMGYLFQVTLANAFGISVPWWIVSLVGLGLLHLLSYQGIRLSSRVTLYLGLAELSIMGSLAITLLADHLRALTLAPFTLALAPHHSWSAVGLGVVFALFAFTGFESAAPLGEEASRPHETVGRAIWVSALAIGLWFVLGAYAGVIGWGPTHLAGYVAAGNPWMVLAHRYWGPAWTLVTLAIFFSQFANGLAARTAGSRVLYALARGGHLPAALARLHPRYRTPSIAVTLQTAVNTALVLGLGFLLQPFRAASLVAEILTLAAICVYIACCAALPFFLHRAEGRLSWLRHVAVPGVAVVFLAAALLASVVPSVPFPLSMAPWIALAWLVLGGVAYLAAGGPRRATAGLADLRAPAAD